MIALHLIGMYPALDMHNYLKLTYQINLSLKYKAKKFFLCVYIYIYIYIYITESKHKVKGLVCLIKGNLLNFPPHVQY